MIPGLPEGMRIAKILKPHNGYLLGPNDVVVEAILEPIPTEIDANTQYGWGKQTEDDGA